MTGIDQCGKANVWKIRANELLNRRIERVGRERDELLPKSSDRIARDLCGVIAAATSTGTVGLIESSTMREIAAPHAGCGSVFDVDLTRLDGPVPFVRCKEPGFLQTRNWPSD